MGESAIAVAVRSRPLLGTEVPPASPIVFHNGTIVQFSNASYSYDFAFPPEVTNESVYNLAVADKIHHLFEGFNVTILAYGPTGSGKTYTMGTDYNPNRSSNSDLGIIPRGLNEVFRILDSEKDVKNFSVKVSFLECYGTDVFDLLKKSATSCIIREDAVGVFKVFNLTIVPVNSVAEAFALLTKGSGRRHTGSTAKNDKSSRSHAIFSVYIEQTDKMTLVSKHAKFQLVDLAGAERQASSKTVGSKFKEGNDINMGLLALTNVINALYDALPHIPYRDSKLTRLLKDSLGGSSHTVIIACLNPSSTSVEETVNTLKYARRLRKVKNCPILNIDKRALQIEQLKKQVETLQAALEDKYPPGSSSKDDKSTMVHQSSFTKIRSLTDKLLKFEEMNLITNEKLQSFFEDLRSIIIDLKAVVAPDSELQSHLNKLEFLQAECLQLLEDRKSFRLTADAEHNSGSFKICEGGECSELASTSETDVEPSDDTDILPQREQQLVEVPNRTYILPQIEGELLEDTVEEQSSAQYLDEVTKELVMKEDMAREIQNLLDGSCDEEERDLDLKKQLQNLIKEKKDFQASIKKTEEKFRKEIQEKVNQYEAQIKNLEEDLRKNMKSKQTKEENKVKMELLKKEIENLKQTKVKIMHQMKDNANKHKQIQRQKDKDIAKLEREGRKKDIELSKMKTKFFNQMKVLQTKVTQATVSKTKLLQTLKKKSPDQGGVKLKQAKEEWVEEELKIAVANGLEKAELELMEKYADTLRINIKDFEELASTSEVDLQQPCDAHQMKVDLQDLLDQIADMKEKVKEDQSLAAKSCIISDGITNLLDAKPVIEYLFKKCATAEVEAVRQLQITDKNQKEQAINEDKIKSLSEEINSLKDEMAKYKSQQAKGILQLKYHYESKLLDYVKELHSTNLSSETADPIIARRMELQEETIRNLQSLHTKHESKCAEFDELAREYFKLKKGERSNWLSHNFKVPSTSSEGVLSTMEKKPEDEGVLSTMEKKPEDEGVLSTMEKKPEDEGVLSRMENKPEEEFSKVKKGERSNWMSHDFSKPSTSSEGVLSTMENKPEDEENVSMLSEYLSEESFSNDPNDPDWRLTPLHKQAKRARLERKAILNAASKANDSGSSKSQENVASPPDSESLLKRSFSSCQCLGECKTMRCGCKKRRVKCSDSCSCDKAHCLNNEK